ncbi:ADP-ribosylglycohydrolase family protein [Anabaena lutea]|uniref:ADP-ribosylglycohydrolase family protein n=1 Tax=Anabaena lutea FACHB-196 TaxID=2692881 RepID=A0ABR8FE91_9NOST|nr:ADP-ribosylglycohydrolase family protein [Anabaena lutea]MBD2568026.1 ADP-ribosylglycohydrolase family protein [Anabaena lutea FACHB-196]
MRYSLVNRVRGIFLGALLGENLARQNPSDLGKRAILGSESLIALGRLDVDDWLKRYQQASVELETTETGWVKIILATLPVAIFYHEDNIKLKHNLQQVLQICKTEPIVEDAALVIGYAIAQSLTEKLHPLTLIPQTISFLDKTPTSLPQDLLKVNSLLQQGAGLEQARAELSKQEQLSNNIALAFYCFLSTLEDFRLTVLRATHKDNDRKQDPLSLRSQTRGAITGALSGAYNSTASIPVNWQVSSVTKPAWGKSSFAQILELADALVAVWSGIYDLEPEKSVLSDLGLLPTFAAPSVIRPR